MNAPLLPPAPAPLPNSDFDVYRRNFFAAVAAMLSDPTMTKVNAAIEIESTINVLLHMARHVGLRIDA